LFEERKVTLEGEAAITQNPQNNKMKILNVQIILAKNKIKKNKMTWKKQKDKSDKIWPEREQHFS
jgi:hypothetical protein